MDNLPAVQPRFAPQPPGVAWPKTEWPRGQSAHQDELDAVVDEMFSDEQHAVTNAVVVVQGGRVLSERYGGEQFYFDRPAEPIARESQLLSWSTAKSMLHLVVGTLVDEGRLNPDELAAVPEWRDESDPRHRIRVRDLLAMRDGLDFVEEYEIGQTSHVIEMLFGDGQVDMAAFTAVLPLVHEPGTFFNYSSGTTNILSRIVADLVGYGEAYRSFLDERLFGAIGMTSAVPEFDQRGVFVASSFVRARALDFAKFGLLYLRGGEWEGRRVVSREWAATAQVPLSVEASSGLLYSWQWWVTGDEYGTYWANGYEGQMITVVPALDALVLRFGHSPAQSYAPRRAWRERLLAVLAK